jgi:uncharacterized repeat protein (TIGR01451 family)
MMSSERFRSGIKRWRSPLRHHVFLATLFWVAATDKIPAWSQGQPLGLECPTGPAEIEVLPRTICGDTCHDFPSRIDEYKGICSLPGIKYPGKEDIYTLRLHKGNEVAFHLTAEENVDFVLALLKERNVSDSCVSNSADVINVGDEDIPAAQYLMDDSSHTKLYYLYIDSPNITDSPTVKACGRYTLIVTGDNPTPDLVLALVGSTDSVVAGQDLTYTLTVTNKGSLDATGVKVDLSLAEGVEDIRPDSGCTLMSPREVRCEVQGNLAVGAQEHWGITVQVESKTRGLLTSTATATANEGDPTSPNTEAVTTTVEADSRLSITMDAPASVVAGRSLTYTIKAHNYGPSDATGVEIMATLPADVLFSHTSPNISTDCEKKDDQNVICRISRIVAEKDLIFSIFSDVKASASDGSFLSASASVKAKELDPRLDVRDGAETKVFRRTNFSIEKSASASTVKAGQEEDLTYTITVTNQGPSDSTGVTITDSLEAFPAGVVLNRSSLSPGCELSGQKITCHTIAIPAHTSPLSVSFSFHVDPSQATAVLSNKATVAANETDPILKNNTSKTVITDVKVEADLDITLKALRPATLAETTSVIAGETLIYQITVTNGGPSNSRGGTIEATLAGVKDVASPNGECEDGAQGVTCSVPALRKDESVARSFRVRIDSSSTDTSLQNEARVTSEDDPKDGNDHDNNIVDVERKATLIVSLSDLPDPVQASSMPPSPPPTNLPLKYTLSVVNQGPSDADSFSVRLKLPQGALLLQGAGSVTSNDCSLDPTPPGDVLCDFASLPANSSQPSEVVVEVLIPDGHKTVRATASVPDTCPQFDPQCQKFEDEEITTVATMADVVLSLAKSADKEPAVVGEELQYKLEVTNVGFSDAPDVKVVDTLLPDALEFVPGDPSLSDDMTCRHFPGTDDNVTTCGFGSIPKSSSVSRFLTAKAKPASRNYQLHNSAEISPSMVDPNLENDKAETDTLVLANQLVLPFFEVTRNPTNFAVVSTTKLAVSNPSSQSVCVRYDYIPDEGQEPKACQLCSLGPKKIHTQDLKEAFLQASAEGYVGITMVECPAQPCPADIQAPCNLSPPPHLPSSPPIPPLSGDFIRVDAAAGPAAALPLVATATARVPPELCRRWTTRFFNSPPGSSVKESTEFFFFAPGDHSVIPASIVGKVYDETGQLFQEISVTATQEAFRRVTEAEGSSTGGLRLLPSVGAIEWEFRNSIGNVSAIHRTEDGGRKQAVALPGFCRDGDRGTGAPLVVPYYEVEPSREAGKTTLFAVRNETDTPVDIRNEYFSANGTLKYIEPPLTKDPLTLVGHATMTVNLRDVVKRHENGEGTFTGYVQVTHNKSVLSGDFVLLTSGGASVNTPAQLCQNWSVRFLNGEPPDSTTDFVVYFDQGTGASAVGQVFSESGGTAVGSIKVPAKQNLLRAFQFPVPAMTEEGGGMPLNGTIEWDLGVKGNVASILKVNGLAVLVPGVCISP